MIVYDRSEKIVIGGLYWMSAKLGASIAKYNDFHIQVEVLAIKGLNAEIEICVIGRPIDFVPTNMLFTRTIC